MKKVGVLSLAVFFCISLLFGFRLFNKYTHATKQKAIDIKFYDQYAPQLQSDLGFKHGSPYYKVGTFREVMTLEEVKSNGIFARAGVKDGDIVADESLWYIRFYKTLEEARGKTFVFSVVDGGEGSPLKERKERKISVNVPK